MRLHKLYPNTIRLAVHLEDRQMVYYRGNETLENVILRNHDSTLMAWFKLNRTTPDARHLKYTEVPRYYTWDKLQRKGKRQTHVKPMITRLYFVHPVVISNALLCDCCFCTSQAPKATRIFEPSMVLRTRLSVKLRWHADSWIRIENWLTAFKKRLRGKALISYVSSLSPFCCRAIRRILANYGAVSPRISLEDFLFQT